MNGLGESREKKGGGGGSRSCATRAAFPSTHRRTQKRLGLAAKMLVDGLVAVAASCNDCLIADATIGPYFEPVPCTVVPRLGFTELFDGFMIFFFNELRFPRSSSTVRVSRFEMCRRRLFGCCRCLVDHGFLTVPCVAFRFR